jgi:hypothetical protein
VPSSGVPNADRVADALDIVEGLGIERVVHATNAAWMPIGIDPVAAAASRLHAPARRRELEVG